MTCREENGQTWKHTYNDENRLSVVEKIAGTCASPGATSETMTFTYDGNGRRVKQVYDDGVNPDVTTLYFAGGMYEVQDSSGAGETIVRYYGIAGQKVARYDGTDLQYMLTDQQGSTIAVLNDTGTLLSEQRYLPFGDVRTDMGTVGETDFGYTGQREIEGSDLMDYNARFLNPGLSRFTQPDTIIPNAGNPQTLNRYSYALNNPIRYTDPTGHRACEDLDGCEPPKSSTSSGSAYTTTSSDGVVINDSEKRAIEKDARDLANKKARTYNTAATRYNKFASEVGGVSEEELLPELSAEELYDIVFQGKTNFNFVAEDCGGCRAKRDGMGVEVGRNNLGTTFIETHPGFITHELGHIFNERTNGAAYASLTGAGLGRDQGGWANERFEGAQFSESTDTGEVWGDMFVGYGQSEIGFDVTKPIGRSRQSQMNATMARLLINIVQGNYD